MAAETTMELPPEPPPPPQEAFGPAEAAAYGAFCSRLVAAALTALADVMPHDSSLKAADGGIQPVYGNPGAVAQVGGYVHLPLQAPRFHHALVYRCTTCVQHAS